MPTRLVLVPNELHDAINAELNKVIAAAPAAEADRDYFYNELLNHYDRYGVIPDFRLQAGQ